MLNGCSFIVKRVIRSAHQPKIGLMQKIFDKYELDKYKDCDPWSYSAK